MARNKEILERGIPQLVGLYEKTTGKPQAFVFICVDADTTAPQTVLLSDIEPPTDAIRLMEGAIKQLQNSGDNGVEDVEVPCVPN